MTDSRSPAHQLRQRQGPLAERVVALSYAAQPAVWERYGEAGRQSSLRDAAYLLTFLAEAVAFESPSLFMDFVAWGKVFFAAIRLPEDTLSQALRFSRQAIQEQMNGAERALALLETALTDLSALPSEVPSLLSEVDPFAQLSQEYLQSLLRGERTAAVHQILAAIEAGLPIQDVYLKLLQPTQRELGRLWQCQRITVGQEHFCSAATQLVMAQMYPKFTAGGRNGRRTVVAGVGEELHDIGLRMVADFFDLAGWDAYYLGANVPIPSVLRALVDQRAELLAIGATMNFHVSKVSLLVNQVRATPALSHLRILVGGRPFNLDPGLAQRLGADGCAADAEAAVRLAEQMVR